MRRHHFCLPDASDALVLARAGSVPHPSSLRGPDAINQGTAAADAVAFQHALRRLAHRPKVEAAKVSLLAAAHEYGVGATVHSLALATLDSLGRNHTLFAPKLILWANREECQQSDLSCFFSSLPSLDDAASSNLDSTKRPRIAIDGMSQPQWQRIVNTWFGPGSAHAVPIEMPTAMASLEQLAAAMKPRMQASRHRTAATCRRAGSGCVRVLPSHFAGTTDESAVLSRLPREFTRHGRFWLIAQTLHFITRPNAALRHQLRRERFALRLRAHHPVLALHVRKGDACKHRGECRSLAAFMPEVRRVARTYGIRAVFLSTPSADVRAETAHYPEFTWLFRKKIIDAATASNVTRLEEGLLNRRVRALDEWNSLMLDVYLMAEAQAIVGAFSSSAARLALALMAAAPGGCLKPFVSVDINWCFAFFHGGPEVLRRGAEHSEISVLGDGSRAEREARGAAAAKRVVDSGMTC